VNPELHMVRRNDNGRLPSVLKWLYSFKEKKIKLFTFKITSLINPS